MKFKKKTLAMILSGVVLGFYLRGCTSMGQDYQIKYNDSKLNYEVGK